MTDDGNAQAIQQKAAACQKALEDVVEGRAAVEDFEKRLRELGASSLEGSDYVQQLEQRLRQQSSRRGQAQPSQASSATQPSQTHSSSNNSCHPSRHPSREATPSGLSAEEVAEFRDKRDQLLQGSRGGQQPATSVTEDIEWSLLRAKLEQLRSLSASRKDSFSFDDIVRLLDGRPSSSGSSIPASVLAAAPHLSSLSEHALNDTHLQTTWKLRQAYASDKAIDPLIDLMQLQPLVDPIPRTIWRNIIQDQYVNLEKLYASMDRGYSHEDEAKDFAGGYALVRKDQYSAKKPIKQEAEWIRVFTAWKSSVTLLFPHRQEELQSYCDMVIDLFRAAPFDPSVAIQFDIEARDRYARNPYRMDDRSRLHLPLLAQMFRKREMADHSFDAPAKRAAVPCQNWNQGICSDPCVNRRRHGICCECGGRHQAREKESCNSSLEARSGKGYSARYPEGGNSSAGRA
ncbi:uncharacterized protein LACBIDRAFT_298826 [Laccaria bicolor S238N-H82]|uniref:Predicted protein n=1 Tax=Laccaria bicolor (strain S238N-H82 / ATCC MYA-4686) TaxID=486041 RepID=B0E3I4_LACBS|nr:uncharacterized protein LACBIDRAFT_298826 [Laccaria bicolor S238N-H82]EDQ98591.1 predicted protein [Laccaria bicolor S238N-H82]|eukprot:XP_001890752.1 predicted protein [Laccaria bicolor S238N-H82]